MKFSFDSIEEIKDFVAQLKGTRGGKKGDGDEASGGAVLGAATGAAPAPLQPPTGTAAGFPGTAAPQTFAPPASGAFPGPGAATLPPEVTALVARISAKIDSAIAGGQPAEQVLNWFRGRCGAEAANATLDQIKTVFLPKMPVPMLDDTAKLMNA